MWLEHVGESSNSICFRHGGHNFLRTFTYFYVACGNYPVVRAPIHSLQIPCDQ